MYFLCLNFFRGILSRSCSNMENSEKNRVKNYKHQSESIGVIFSGNKHCDGEAELAEVW